MEFSLDHRTASLSAGEFATFNFGPRSDAGGESGLWRAQLGTHWHQQLRAQTTAENSTAVFELPISGRIVRHGWTLLLSGRIDQLVPNDSGTLLREIKTVTHALPVPEARLRAAHAYYFLQLAAYSALLRANSLDSPPSTFNTSSLRAEVVFVEVATGLAQPVTLAAVDEALFETQLERIIDFLDRRLRARENRRSLRFQPAFSEPRPGQIETLDELAAALEPATTHIFFEAPTGFGKTGILLEAALTHLRAGRCDRVLYLTSKATGQLQVLRTLQAMGNGPKTTSDVIKSLSPITSHLSPAATPVAAWLVRPKSEHCINPTFHCVREVCGCLDNAAERWPQSGLSQLYLFPDQPHGLDVLRTAGRNARICPYEITRAALAFQDVWIGDYNYVFSPRHRSLFYEQPGFDPAHTLLIVDEAHNLPARAADAFSYTARATDAQALLAALDDQRASTSLLLALETWVRFLAALSRADSLEPAVEADLEETLDKLTPLVTITPLDYAALGPQLGDLLWQTSALQEWLDDDSFQKLLWCPREGELAFTCLDAAAAIGETLRAYGAVVLASATLGPPEIFAENCGLTSVPPTVVKAAAPWRDTAYDVAIDARVDTTFQHRSRHYATTAATIEALHAKANSPVAVFFSSYAYADAIQNELASRGSLLRIALQPRLPDLAAQTAWVEESLLLADALFLVLGSSFAESIDLLGGRITHAMVVGPALPEVNAVQRARLASAERNGLTREQAFRRVYQVPGMQKVNQALGRLVRAPGQHARVLLHCRRFAEPSYAPLLASEYQFGELIANDADLEAWLG
ncbi:MAG: DEAD/DEAH box helicase family protein [Verrucomicrobiota bacterium]|nr:DEAD/DEAH box helicase family protein [Verrucomicrobiota bacterium]